MRRHRSSRRRSDSLPRRLWNHLASLVRKPARLAAMSAMCVFLGWVIVIRTVPYTIAQSSPDLALWFSPDNPTALIAKAFLRRDEMLKLASKSGPPSQTGQPEDTTLGTTAPDGATTTTTTTATKATTTTAITTAQTEPGTHDAPASSILASEETARLRVEIRSLALRAIASEPLNAQAFRLLAELSDDPDQTRELMQAAFDRSRREAQAVYWLLNEAYSNRRIADVLRYADVLLRTQPPLAPYVTSYLAQIAGDQEGRKELVALLGTGPKWRPAFFASLTKHVSNVDTPLVIMIALKETEHPATPRELHSYLDALIGQKQPDAAYNAWLQMQPSEILDTLGLLDNPSFDREPSGAPFDWRIERGQNAIAEFVPLVGNDGARGLHIQFGNGRVKFPSVSQVLVLGQGRFRFDGQLRGQIIAKRGLRWRISCAFGKRQTLGETDMLLGQWTNWSTFGFDVEIPDLDDCRAQRLTLIHDARSSSEQLITGEVWFDDLKLNRIQP